MAFMKEFERSMGGDKGEGANDFYLGMSDMFSVMTFE